MGFGFVTGVGWFMPKFSPVRNGGWVISLSHIYNDW